MKKEHSKEHSAAIIVDCWEDPPGNIKICYDNIEQFIKNKKNLDLVLFATFPCSDLGVSISRQSPYWKVPWEENLRRFIPKENYWDKSNQYYSNVDFYPPEHIKNWWRIFNNHNIFFNEIVKQNSDTHCNYGPFLNYNHTDSSLTSIRPNKNQTFLGCWTIDQLSYLCNSHFSQITKLYFLGGSWEDCIHHRAIGIPHVTKAIKSGRLKNITQLATLQNHIYNNKGYTVHNFGAFGWPGWIHGANEDEFLINIR